MPCFNCNGIGLAGGCHVCGKYFYSVVEPELAKKDSHLPQAKIPSWYKTNAWDITLAQKADDHTGAKKVLTILNDMVNTSSSGTLPNASYMILLPARHGKRHALFTMIANYQRYGLQVAPVTDISTFNILASRNRYEDQSALLSIMTADITFVYGTDFITRKLTAQIFRSICSSRALTEKPTILFSGYSFDELSSWDNVGQTLRTNLVKEDHYATPYILDGVVRRDRHDSSATAKAKT